MVYIQKPITFQALNNEQLQSLMVEIANIQFDRSSVVGSKKSEFRTSDSASLPYKSHCTKFLKSLAARTFDVHEHQCEPSIHIARYKKHQQYMPHHDSCCEITDACTAFKKEWGDRIGTLLVYLNDDFKGGETEFPHLHLKIQPKAGMAVAWRSSSCPDWALHAGKPIATGCKIILTIWVRDKRTH